MASIIKRNDKWFVRVRKHGQPSQSKTFTITRCSEMGYYEGERVRSRPCWVR